MSYSSSVKIEWTNLIGTTGDEYGDDLTIGTDGFVYVTGYTEGGLDGQADGLYGDAYISKFDTDGNKSWTITLDSESDEHARAITAGIDNHIFVAGTTRGEYYGNPRKGIGQYSSDIFVSKIDFEGNIIWNKLIGSINQDYVSSLTTGKDGSIFITGSVRGDLSNKTNNGEGDAFITKINSDGIEEWTSLVGSSAFELAHSITIGDDGSIFITGWSNGNLNNQTNKGLYDAFVTKLDGSGIEQWTKLVGSSKDDYGYGITVDSDNSIYISGGTYGNLESQTNLGNSSAFITKLNTQGDILWSDIFSSGPDFDRSHDLVIGNNGSVYIAGYSRGNYDGITNNGFEDIFITKLDSESNKDYSFLYGSISEDYAARIISSQDGDFYLTGYTTGNLNSQINNGGKDSFLMKLVLNAGNSNFAISGTTQIAQSLSITESTSDPDGTGTLSYVWQSSSDENTWTQIGTDSTYALSSSEEGKKVRAILSYIDDKGFSESVTTTPVDIKTDEGDAVFAISGTTQVAQTLSITESAADPDGTGTLSYVWQSSSNETSWTQLGTDSIYTLTSTEDGKKIRAILSYTDDQGFSESVTTTPVDIKTDYGDASFSITGTKEVGQTLSISEDSADPDGGGTLRYSWQTSSENSSWSEVGTSPTYTVGASEEGKSIRAIISYQDAKGFDESVTTSTSSILYEDDGDAKFGFMRVVNGSNGTTVYGTETLEIGETIKGGLVSSDPDGGHSLATETYSWQTSSDNSNWSVVGTSLTYTIASTDEGKSVRSVTSYKDAQGFNEEVISYYADGINVKSDQGDASFSIVGPKSVGNYLSIKRDSQDPDGAGELSYQWQSSSDGNTWSNESTNSTYRLKYTDSDKYYKATISYTDDDGFSESITTDTIQIDKHSIHTSLESLKSQLSNLTYSTSFDYASLGYSEEFGSSGGDTLYAGENEIVWGLAGDDSLKTSYSYNFSDHILIGGSGNDTYRIRGDVVAIIYEAPNHGNNDSLYLSSNYYYYGYAASIDNKHLFAIYDDQAVFVLDAWENKGIENIYLGSNAFTSTYFLQLLPSLPGYLGNVRWDELKPYTGDKTIDTAKSLINEIKSATKSVESDFENSKSNLNSQISSLEDQANDLNQSTEEVLFTNQLVGNSYHLTGIRDYDGNFHANTGSVSDAIKSSYKYQGMIDVNKDGIAEAIYTNKESGRWVTASVISSTGEIDYSDHGTGGSTRVVGIYEDPLVQSGDVISGSDHDSQTRFQNDLLIDNLIVKTSGDYDGDGDQEVYWKTTDGTAYLRALMHADGNIQYANYQSEEQMSNYLTINGYESVISDII